MANRTRGVGPYSQSAERLRRPDPSMAGNALGTINKATRLSPESYQLSIDKLEEGSDRGSSRLPRGGR